MHTINYFNNVFRQDKQAPINITASGFYYEPTWEVTGAGGEHAGSFAPRVSNMTTVLTPYNRTQEVTVRLYDTIKPAWALGYDPNLVYDTPGDEISYPVFVGTYGEYHGASGIEYCASGDCFVETKVAGNAYNRGFGLTDAAPEAHGYSWASEHMDYAIALGQVNSASFWVKGESVVGAYSSLPGVIYKEGDIFRIGVESGNVCFRHNGKLIYQDSPLIAPTNLHPIVSFFEHTTKLSQVRFWQASYEKAEAPLKVWGVMPVCQDKISEHEVTEIAEVSEAEAQRGRDKIVRYHAQQDKWDLVFSGRRLSELQAVRDFRAFHRIHIPFYMADQPRGLDKLVVFETGIKDRLIQSNMFDFSCTVKEY